MADMNQKLNAAMASKWDPQYPGFYKGMTDGDGDFDGAIDMDVRSVGGKAS